MTIKENIIKNFLNPYYMHTVVSMKSTLAADIRKRSWFPCTIRPDDVIVFYVGDEIQVEIKIFYDETDNKIKVKKFE